MKKLNLDKLTILGSGKTVYPVNPEKARLEVIENLSHQNRTVVTLRTDEFTALCPKTEQPDFGEIIIEYIPGNFLIESKSLKLYLFSFRNVGMFQEFIVNKILNDLKKAIKPKWIRVTGKFKPRGGISITPVAECGKNPNIRQHL